MESAKSETKYERLRKIGVGSYGVVFKCANRQTGQIVAIKRYSENDSDPVIRKIAMREVRMLRQLKHPNLIRLIEVFRRKRILHLVFDYCELTVLDVIDRYGSSCSLNFIKKIIWQLANGVSHCHSHNCIHRDIKPENILINQAGIVKLCDFGFARNIKGNASVSGASSTSSSRTAAAVAACAKQVQYEREAKLLGVVVPAHHHSSAGVQVAAGEQQAQLRCTADNNQENNAAAYLAGERQALTEYVATRWYRAPELLVGDIYYDTKIDIWAIGCVTAELMRGEPLWPGKTDLDQLSTIMSSLGALTASQSHTLLTAGLYDHTSTERLLSQTRVTDPLERRVPARVGPEGEEFVLACLRMDPARRPTCDELLEHTFVRSVKMVQFVRGATTHAKYVVSDSNSPARHITPARAAQAPMSRSNSQAILRVAQQQQQPPTNKRLVVAPDSTSPSASSSSITSRTNDSLLTTDPSASLHSSHKRSGSNPSAHSLVPVPVRNQSLVALRKQRQSSPVSTQTIDSSRRRRRDRKPAPSVVDHSRSKSRSKLETTNHTVTPQTTVTPSLGTTRRSSRQHAPIQTSESQGVRPSQSQSKLPSATYQVQQQQQQQPAMLTESNTSRSEQRKHQRHSMQMGSTSHLVALVEPTKRDRQRTNLDHYGKTRSRGGKQRAGVKASEPVGAKQAALAQSMSHNILPPT